MNTYKIPFNVSKLKSLYGPPCENPSRWGYPHIQKIYGQNYRKFQNLLEVQEWHENKSVGQVRGEIEVLEHPFWPPFLAKCTS